MSIKKLILVAPLRMCLQNIMRTRCYCSKGNSILDSAVEEPMYAADPERSSDLEVRRNKSKLYPGHRNMLMDKKPYDEPVVWYHNTIRYKKRMLGRYGLEALDVPAGVLWPTQAEIEDKEEYERTLYPLSLQERLKKIHEEKKKKQEAIIARQKEVELKMLGMHALIADVEAKIAKKAAAEEEAKLRKERRIEEIRQKLINEGSMTKEKLEKALTQAEKDEKKKKKELKKQKLLERQEKLLKEMVAKETTAEDAVDAEAELETGNKKK